MSPVWGSGGLNPHPRGAGQELGAGLGQLRLCQTREIKFMLGGGGPIGARRQRWAAAALSSPAGCAELYFLRYGHTDRWAHPDGQTTDKCNSHAHASGRAPPSLGCPSPQEPLPGPPRLGGERWALPRGAGRRGWGGQLSQPHSSGQRGPQPHNAPQRTVSQGDSRSGCRAKLCQHHRLSTRWCQSTPDLPPCPPTRHGAGLPLLSSGAGGSMLCPPAVPHCSASLCWWEGLRGSPWGPGTPHGSFCRREVTPCTKGAGGRMQGTAPRTGSSLSSQHLLGGYLRPQAEPVPRPVPSSPSTICPS